MPRSRGCSCSACTPRWSSWSRPFRPGPRPTWPRTPAATSSSRPWTRCPRAGSTWTGRCPRGVVSELLGRSGSEANMADASYGKLSRREQQVLRLLAEGLAPAAIAERLFISRKTVENHRTNILHKLNIREPGGPGALCRAHGPHRPGDRRLALRVVIPPPLAYASGHAGRRLLLPQGPRPAAPCMRRLRLVLPGQPLRGVARGVRLRAALPGAGLDRARATPANWC